MCHRKGCSAQMSTLGHNEGLTDDMENLLPLDALVITLWSPADNAQCVPNDLHEGRFCWPVYFQMGDKELSLVIDTTKERGPLRISFNTSCSFTFMLQALLSVLIHPYSSQLYSPIYFP